MWNKYHPDSLAIFDPLSAIDLGIWRGELGLGFVKYRTASVHKRDPYRRLRIVYW